MAAAAGAGQTAGAAAAPAAAAHVPHMAHTMRERVKAHRLLKVFNVLSGITIACALLTAMAVLLSLIYMREKTLPSFTVKLYALLFLLVIVLSELEWTKMVRENAITHNWIVRGAFYVFVGTLVYQEKPDSGRVTKVQDAFISFTSIALIVIGFIYAAMGICFVKRWRDGARAKYRTMLAHAEMADNLERSQGPPQV